MKNKISISLIVLFATPVMAFAPEQYYVAVVHDLSSKTGDVIPPRLLDGSYNVSQSRIENGYKVVYSNINLSKKDCKKLIKRAINGKKSAYKTVPKEDSRYAINKKSIFADTYVVDQVSEFISVYYCVPIEMWAEIKPQEQENIGKTINYENGIILRKNNEDFIQKLHHCGITDYNFFHINIPETPFICEKYNTEQPIPHKTYNELVGYEKYISAKK